MAEAFQPITLLLTLFFVAGTFFLSSLRIAFRRLGKLNTKIQLQQHKRLFFYYPIHTLFFPHHEVEGLFFALTCSQFIITFAATICLTLLTLVAISLSLITTLIVAAFAFVLLFVLSQFIPRVWGFKHPAQVITISAFPASFFLLFTVPFSFVFLLLFPQGALSLYFESIYEMESLKKKQIFDLVLKTDVGQDIDPIDLSLVGSVLTFNNRITREIMVPRVDLLALEAETTIIKAVEILEEEGYSRVPVYKGNIDNIVGILMHKDLLSTFFSAHKENKPSLLQRPIETIVKSVIYAPETKKISHLLQEFRAKKLHMAIVVDEYGGTEGIVTIEDILEEIVGEIADEYDVVEELFTAMPEGGWVVDAGMSLIDVESELGIKIPQEGDYDTVRGYIFHRAGTIPPRGFTIHHDDFNLKVVSSDERSVNKVRIIPIKQSIS